MAPTLKFWIRHWKLALFHNLRQRVGKYVTDAEAALYRTLETTPLRDTLSHPLLLSKVAVATFDRRDVCGHDALNKDRI